MMRSGGFRVCGRISGDKIIILVVSRRKDSGKRLKRIAKEDSPEYG